MEQEDNHKRKKQSERGQIKDLEFSTELANDLQKIIQVTYSSSSNLEIQDAENKLAGAIQNHPGIMNMILEFVSSKNVYSMNQYNFQLACANIIQKQCYKLAQNYENHINFIEAVYLYVLDESQPHQLQEIVGKGLQYILALDPNTQFKMELINSVIEKINSLSLENWNGEFLNKIYGKISLTLICLNSLQEIQEVCEFVLSVLYKTISISSVCLNIITNVKDLPESSFDGIFKIFSFIELVVEKILGERQLIEVEYQQIKEILVFNQVFYQYLLAFSQEGSIITSNHILNKVKLGIIEFLGILYEFQQTPKEFIELMTITMIKQCNRSFDGNGCEGDIICKIMRIIQVNLQRKKYYEFFISLKKEFLSALLLYSRTTEMEQLYLQQDPQKFIEIQFEYSQCFSSSNLPKIKAASLIKSFVQNTDEGRSTIFTFLLPLLSYAMENANLQHPEVIKYLKESQSWEFFMKTNHSEKLDVLLMVMTVIAPILEKYQDEYNMYLKETMSHIHKFYRNKDHLILIRSIHMIGYYPNSLFFGFIYETMRKYRGIFITQGLKTFEKIARNVKYLETYKQVHRLYIALIEYMEIGDNLFENLMMQNFKIIVQGDYTLMKSIVNKIRQAFFRNVSHNKIEGEKHTALLCLNYIDKLVKEDSDYKIVFECISDMKKVGLNIPLFEDSFIDIQLNLLKLFENKPPFYEQEQFILFMCNKNRFDNFSIYSKFFLLLNQVLASRQIQLQTVKLIHMKLLEYLQTFTYNTFNKLIAPQICFTLGYILIKFPRVMSQVDNYDVVLNMMTDENDKTKIWLQLFYLQLMQIRPDDVRIHLLKKMRQTSFFSDLIKSKFFQKIERKITIICLSNLIPKLQNPEVVKAILKLCVTLLKNQHEIFQDRPKRNQKREETDSKMRKLLVVEESEEEEKMENEDEKLKEDSEFKEFTHPFDDKNEFQVFRNIILTLELKSILNEHEIQEIREVLSINWHSKGTRVMHRVKMIHY